MAQHLPVNRQPLGHLPKRLRFQRNAALPPQRLPFLTFLCLECRLQAGRGLLCVGSAWTAPGSLGAEGTTTRRAACPGRWEAARQPLVQHPLAFDGEGEARQAYLNWGRAVNWLEPGSGPSLRQWDSLPKGPPRDGSKPLSLSHKSRRQKLQVLSRFEK